MAAKKDLSIDDILALARGNKPAAGGAAEKTEPVTGPPPKPEATTKATTKSAEPKKTPSAKGAAAGPMSVDDILAAARGKAGGESASAAAAPQAPKPAASSPKAATGGGKPGAMSVDDMLAAARGQKKADAPAKAEPVEKAEPKAPVAKADKPAAKKSEAAAAVETSSILAAARGARPGPMSKAEAAAKAKGSEGPGKTKLVVPPMPEKPAYAKVAAPAAADETRRGFFSMFAAALAGSYMAVGFSSLAITNLLWALGSARFMFPNILTEPPTKFKVGFSDDYGQGQVETKYIAQYGVWVVKHEYEGRQIIYALKTVCTHLGCTPNWLEAEQKFKCPCHGSGFYKDGVNFEGPAPRPLERYAIRRADDGQLEIDKSRTFLEEKGDWKDPASFVAV